MVTKAICKCKRGRCRTHNNPCLRCCKDCEKAKKDRAEKIQEKNNKRKIDALPAQNVVCHQEARKAHRVSSKEEEIAQDNAPNAKKRPAAMKAMVLLNQHLKDEEEQDDNGSISTLNVQSISNVFSWDSREEEVKTTMMRLVL